MNVFRSLSLVAAAVAIAATAFAQAPPPPAVAPAVAAASEPPPTHDQVCATLNRRYDRLYAEAARAQPAKRSFLGGMVAGLGSAAIGGLVATSGVGALGRVAMAGGGVVGTQMAATAISVSADAANSALVGDDDPMGGINQAVGALTLVQALARVNTQAIEQDCASPAARHAPPPRHGLLGQLVR